MALTLSHILDALNESQKRAVTTIEGPVLIVAGPGTGKTLTIVRRIAYLIHLFSQSTEQSCRYIVFSEA